MKTNPETSATSEPGKLRRRRIWRDLAIGILVPIAVSGCMTKLQLGAVGLVEISSAHWELFHASSVVLWMLLGTLLAFWALMDRGIGRLRATVLLILVVAAGLQGRSTGMARRPAAFLELAERSEPLVRAIERFAADTGSPPERLSDLVPTYLAEVPGTGLPAHPEYAISTRSILGDPWVLSVYCMPPMEMFSMDEFIYTPRTTVEPGTTDAWGHHNEPIGTWYYMHDR